MSRKNVNFGTLYFLCVWLTLGFIIHSLQLRIEKQRKLQLEAAGSQRKLPSPQTVRLLSLGFDRVVADLYWLLFIQYYGDPKAADKHRYLLAPAYLDLIIKLDPHFIQPYWFASFILGQELKLVKESEELLDYGIKENPNSWTLPYIAGFNQYLYRDNEKRAAAYYRLGAACPEAPPWLGQQVKILESNVPRLVKTTQVWWQIYKSNDDPMLKDKARTKLIELFSEIYWTAPTKPIKDTAIMRLQSLDAQLLPMKTVPK